MSDPCRVQLQLSTTANFQDFLGDGEARALKNTSIFSTKSVPQDTVLPFCWCGQRPIQVRWPAPSTFFEYF